MLIRAIVTPYQIGEHSEDVKPSAPIAAPPEIFATRAVACSGQVVSAVTSVIGDHVVTMTVAFFPLALLTLPIQDLHLYKVNLFLVVLMPALYAAFIH